MTEPSAPEVLEFLRALQAAGAHGGLKRGDFDEGLWLAVMERGLGAIAQVPVATVPRLFLTVKGSNELQRAEAQDDGP